MTHLDNKESDRLIEFRKECKLSRKDFTNGLGLSYSAYSNIEIGRRPVTYSLLKLLIDTYRLNPIWLITGQGTMFIIEEELKFDSSVMGIIKVETHQKIVEALVDKEEIMKKYIASLENKIKVDAQLIALYEENN